MTFLVKYPLALTSTRPYSQGMETNVTTAQIRRLRTEAMEAGDHVMVEICDMALGTVSLHDPMDERAAVIQARGECARVINSARSAS